ncbi:hypothetical protein [Ensifer aridi]|uniref:hypothetical protein n=1 Tax=Ensifer aridi TaxID=1708715 RepID=UPI00111C5778|nr:hypothetical protein [Ensifer aridi]
MLEWNRDAEQAHLSRPRVSSGKRYKVPSEDEELIRRVFDVVSQNSRCSRETITKYCSGLRRFSEKLHSELGWSLSALSGEELRNFAAILYPDDRNISPALYMLEWYRDAEQAHLPRPFANEKHKAKIDPKDEELITSLCQFARNTNAVANRTLYTYGSALRKLSERLDVPLSALSDEVLVDYANQLRPGDRAVKPALHLLQKYRQTLGEGTSGAAEGSASQPVHEPALSPVHESSPLRLSSFNQDQLWESYDVAEAARRGASPPHSYNSADLWVGVDQWNQVPPQSWGANTSSFWKGMDAPSPAPSVNQPSPGLWQQSAVDSLFGPTQYMQPVPQPVLQPVVDLGEYVPANWQHRNKRAPEELMRGMHRRWVLPSADQPETTFTIHGVPYTAKRGRSGKPSDIRISRVGPTT